VDAAHGFLGESGASLIGIGALVSIGGTLNALMFATPRLLFAMGENRQVAPVFSAIHPYFHTPVVAILLTATMTLALALSSTFISALTISVVVRLVAFMTTCAALPVLRRRPEFPPPTFVVPAGTLIAVAAVALSVWLLTNSPWTEMRVALIAVLLGFVLYLPCRWMARKTSSETSVVA
jgi:amino acid transporter